MTEHGDELMRDGATPSVERDDPFADRLDELTQRLVSLRAQAIAVVVRVRELLPMIDELARFVARELAAEELARARRAQQLVSVDELRTLVDDDTS